MCNRKHFTLNRTLPGPDHSLQSNLMNSQKMIHNIREVEAAIGVGIKDGPSEEESENVYKGQA